jgi:hypothetical protein
VASSSGYLVFNVGGGVSKLQVRLSVRDPPFADRVPAGTVTEYSVAIANLTAGSNSKVFVPTHLHFPGGWGERVTGTVLAASSWEVMEIIGCENVTLRFGARGTSPSGE